MKIEEAARTLRAMYDDPQYGRATAVHLFGIRHASELEGAPLHEIVVRAGLPASYQTEVRKGVNLAAFVVERDPASKARAR